MLFQKERSILYLNGSQRCCVWQQGIQATVLAGKRALGFCWGKRESRNFRSPLAWPPRQQDLPLVSTSRPCHDPWLPLLWGGNFDVIELLTKGPGVLAMTTAILGAKKTLKTQHWLPASP